MKAKIKMEKKEEKHTVLTIQFNPIISFQQFFLPTPPRSPFTSISLITTFIPSFIFLNCHCKFLLLKSTQRFFSKINWYLMYHLSQFLWISFFSMPFHYDIFVSSFRMQGLLEEIRFVYSFFQIWKSEIEGAK